MNREECGPAADIPCPFCRSTHQTVLEIDTDCWTVACINCGANGPTCPTEQGARTAWSWGKCGPE